MRKVLLVAAAAAAVLTAPYFVSAREFSTSGEYHGGADIGPLGQCFNPPDCGRREAINGYAKGCPIVRERIVAAGGHVIYRRRHAC